MGLRICGDFVRHRVCAHFVTAPSEKEHALAPCGGIESNGKTGSRVIGKPRLVLLRLFEGAGDRTQDLRIKRGSVLAMDQAFFLVSALSWSSFASKLCPKYFPRVSATFRLSLGWNLV